MSLREIAKISRPEEGGAGGEEALKHKGYYIICGRKICVDGE